MVLSCLPVKGKPVLRAAFERPLCATGSQPRSPPQDLPRTGPIAIEIVLKVTQNPAPFQDRDSIGNPVLRASLVPPRLSKWCFPASLAPSGCFAGCPIDPFLPPWCLPGYPNGSFLPPWCLAGCPRDPFLPPWCLPGASQAFQKPGRGFCATRAFRRGFCATRAAKMHPHELVCAMRAFSYEGCQDATARALAQG